jgi:hypothetical protein
VGCAREAHAQRRTITRDAQALRPRASSSPAPIARVIVHDEGTSSRSEE